MREEFVKRVLNGEGTKSGLCREYGISRPTGDKWIRRYQEEQSLEDRSRKPAHTRRVDPTVSHVVINPPSVSFSKFVSSRTVDYRTTVTFTAEVTNSVDGAAVHWFIDGQEKGVGDTFIWKEAKKSYTVQAKYIKGTEVLAETGTEKVTVKTGFFARLKAFFRALFGRLPKEAQVYLGVEFIERILP